MSRWSKSGVLDRVSKGPAEEGIIDPEVETHSTDSMIVKVHPHGTGALKRGGPQSIGKSRGGWTSKIHMVAADHRTAVTFSLSPGQDHDAPQGRRLLQRLRSRSHQPYLVADRAYEGDQTRRSVSDLVYTPGIPPKTNGRTAWTYDRDMHKPRSQVERLFRRLKGYRRIFSLYDKLAVLYIGFITFVLIIEALRNVNTP